MTETPLKPVELKACPLVPVGWCKGGKITTYEGDSRFPAYARCESCRTTKMAATEAEAITAWNTRTVDTELLEALKAATRLIDRAADWIDAEETSGLGPAEMGARERLLTAIDSKLVDFRAAITKAEAGS